jgi:endonuclease/exonuclease/phosphatase family metal-dependent hydrolase
MKILSLNLNYDDGKHGAWAIRRGLIAEAIAKSCADLVVLQAVRRRTDREDGYDQAKQLGMALPEFGVVLFEPARDDGEGRQDGSAFLSKVPLADVQAFRLSLGEAPPGSPQDEASRLVLTARVPSADFYVFNSHYSWVPSQTRRNLDEALPFMSRFVGRRLLIGDLNTEAEHELMERLRGHGWIDAWARLRPSEAGYTFESDRPNKRIDYAWVSLELLPSVKGIELVTAAENRWNARLSDHLGILITLE